MILGAGQSPGGTRCHSGDRGRSSTANRDGRPHTLTLQPDCFRDLDLKPGDNSAAGRRCQLLSTYAILADGERGSQRILVVFRESELGEQLRRVIADIILLETDEDPQGGFHGAEEVRPDSRCHAGSFDDRSIRSAASASTRRQADEECRGSEAAGGRDPSAQPSARSYAPATAGIHGLKALRRCSRVSSSRRPDCRTARRERRCKRDRWRNRGGAIRALVAGAAAGSRSRRQGWCSSGRWPGWACIAYDVFVALYIAYRCRAWTSSTASRAMPLDSPPSR